MKKLISLFLALFIIMSLPSATIFAEDSVNKAKNIDFEVTDENGEHLEVEVEVFESFEEYEKYKNLQSLTRAKSYFLIAVVPRNISEYCDIIISWGNGDMYNGWRYKRLTISSTNLISPQTYATLGNGSTYDEFTFSAASSGSYTFTQITLSKNVKQVKIKTTDLQGYSLRTSSWLSTSQITLTGDINW